MIAKLRRFADRLVNGRIESNYLPAKKTKSLAIGPGGQFFFDFGYDTVEESARRILETCGAVVGIPCMIVAADDAFVVPVPTTLKATSTGR